MRLKEFKTHQRWAVTHVNADGYRVLTFANQARNHYESQAGAETALTQFAQGLREKILGSRADTLEVRRITCYENGDAVGIYV